MKLTQRPQHIAKGLGKKGVLYFFYDAYSYGIATQVGNNSYVISWLSPLLYALKNRDVYFHIYATDVTITIDTINGLLAKNSNAHFIYEFVDEISPALPGTPITDEVMVRHNWMLMNPDIFVITTAQALFDQAIAIRGNSNNVILVPNAADVEFFSSVSRKKTILRNDFRKIVEKEKKIL